MDAAHLILAGFDDYQERFAAITARAQGRFEAREWLKAQSDAVERLDLYKIVVDGVVAQVCERLGEQVLDVSRWAGMKAVFARAVRSRPNLELAETFFNSITRRIFSTVGVDPQIEFLGETPAKSLAGSDQPLYDIYACSGLLGQDSLTSLLRSILSATPFHVAYAQLDIDVRCAAAEIHKHLSTHNLITLDRVEILRPVFYRSNGAYLVGRICHADRASTPEPADLLGPGELPPDQLQALRSAYTPMLLCLQHPPQGITLDAVLLDEDEASIVFSFARSYFHVEAGSPAQLVHFLKTILPLKRVAELYISIGFNKHGKTELYRDLIHHLQRSQDAFEIAPGERGMVMLVFSLPSYDMVFKIIKDRPDPPKTATRRDVIQRYELVFKHDRAGRLVDAQEFEHLSFERRRFTPGLLAELQRLAPSQVDITAEYVNIRHLYTERRMTPLNLYVRQGNPAQAQAAVLDYGQALKDLAAANIFPGDVLLKNFGVTRHGRVVFYDYDELCQVSDCKFRKIPPPTSHFDEYADEPYFYVGPNDIFPEEFLTFLGLQEPLRSIFTAAHADLFGVEFWQRVQASHRAGEVIDILPYPESKRLAVKLGSA